MPTGASAAYAHNICALLLHMVKDGRLVIDLEDEIQAGVVITHGGKVVHKPTAELLDGPKRERRCHRCPRGCSLT